MSNPYFKSSAMSWSGSKRKKVGESRISLSSLPKSDNQSNSDFRSPATISSMYPEKEIYKSMITSLRDHTFV